MDTVKRRSPVTAAVALGLLACGASVRTVPVGAHGASGPPPVVVNEPAPVNKVEAISQDPGVPCAWLDGRWEWADEGWQWAPGAWVIPPKACHFALPETVWIPSAERGLLFYLGGRWYPDGSSACDMALPCPTTH